MESAKPSSSAAPYSSGPAGAGGKFRKPPVSRKRPSTPYDRPSQTTGNNKSDESQDAGGGWLSKLVVNPARRLIVGGATKILPSFFSKSDSSSADEYEDDPPGDHDDEEIGLTENAQGDAKHTLKGSLVNIQEDESKNSAGDEGLTKIENMLKGKQFSRDERNRLMEILNSRLVDVSNTEEEKKSPPVISHVKAKEVMVDHTIGNQTPMPHSQSNMKDEVGASPIDIARAYMGNRTSEKLGFNTYNTIKSKEESSDLIPSKPQFLTPSSKSSTCWPGAMVQEQRGYLTPQIPRTRYGLHNLPRTPYSRTIYSTTKPKLNQLQGNNSKFSQTTFQQTGTPNYGQMKSSGDVMEGGYGSVGPIRRVRNKFPIEPQSERRSGSRSFVPVFQKNPEASGSAVDRHEQTYNKGEETVRKIMEKLDRHKPTPKEKAEELKIASENKASLMPSDETSVFGSLIGRDFVKKVDSGVGLKGTVEPMKTFASKQKSTVTNIKEKEKSPLDNQINGQDLTKKRSSLKPILLTKPSGGFTFPLSAAASSASEPPTPSIMPSFPPIGVKEAPPSYSFGTKKTQRLVFSFPSTSSGPIDDNQSTDLKFNFGSDKKRVSFASLGTTNAIAIN